MRVPAEEGAQGQAQAHIEALKPTPTIIIPMLPASVEVVEHAIEVAKSMAQQAELTRAAQGKVNIGTVDQMLVQAA